MLGHFFRLLRRLAKIAVILGSGIGPLSPLAQGDEWDFLEEMEAMEAVESRDLMAAAQTALARGQEIQARNLLEEAEHKGADADEVTALRRQISAQLAAGEPAPAAASAPTSTAATSNCVADMTVAFTTDLGLDGGRAESLQFSYAGHDKVPSVSTYSRNAAAAYATSSAPCLDGIYAYSYEATHAGGTLGFGNEQTKVFTGQIRLPSNAQHCAVNLNWRSGAVNWINC